MCIILIPVISTTVLSFHGSPTVGFFLQKKTIAYVIYDYSQISENPNVMRFETQGAKLHLHLANRKISVPIDVTCISLPYQFVVYHAPSKWQVEKKLVYEPGVIRYHQNIDSYFV